MIAHPAVGHAAGLALAGATVALFLLGAARARAEVAISVDLSTQQMTVIRGNGDMVMWDVSSARAGFNTPRGTYGVERMEPMHHSREYHNSPMPHSIFFHGGYAIHGTSSVASLGSPASHGCVRLDPKHAAKLYAWVEEEGAEIRISGSPPVGRKGLHELTAYGYQEDGPPIRRRLRSGRDWDEPAFHPSYGPDEVQSFPSFVE